MRLLTSAEFDQLGPQQRAVRSHQLQAVVRRYELEHRRRYRGPAALHAELARCAELHAEAAQPRDTLGRFARVAS